MELIWKHLRLKNYSNTLDQLQPLELNGIFWVLALQPVVMMVQSRFGKEIIKSNLMKSPVSNPNDNENQ